ncbi:MAG: hypothetical protein ACPGWR_27915 [Ardenticatenaceae bacterium]
MKLIKSSKASQKQEKTKLKAKKYIKAKTPMIILLYIFGLV